MLKFSTETPEFLIKEGLQTRANIFQYLLTFPEIFTSSIPVVDMQGRLIGGPDRKYTEPSEIIARFLPWQKEVQNAIKGDYDRFREIPKKVHDYFQETKGLTKPSVETINACIAEVKVPRIKGLGETVKKEETTIVEPIPQSSIHTPPKFSWSYTALTEFETCPQKYAASRYYKTTKFEETEASRWGLRVHKAYELALKGQEHESDIINPQYVRLLKEAAEGGQLLTESQIAISRELKVVPWFDKEAWGRGVVDVAVLKNIKAFIYDWKSGKEKIDETQLKIFCIFLALAYKDIQEFEARFIWLKTNNVSPSVTLKRSDLLGELKSILARVERMEQAWQHEIFPCRTNGLCKGYCEDYTCAHNGRKRN